MSDGASHDGGVKKSVKGEKSKKKIVSSPPTSDAGSVSGGGRDGETSADDNDGVDNGVCFPKNRLGNLCWYLDKGRGETRCKVCHGTCCALVKDLINMLVEHGEIEPTEQV